MPRFPQALRPALGAAFGLPVQVDLASVVLLALLIWTLAQAVFPVLVPELAGAAYWAMATLAAMGLVLGIVLRAAALLLGARAMHIDAGALTLYLFGPVLHSASSRTGAGAELRLAGLHLLLTLLLGIAYLALFARGFGANPPLILIGAAFFLALLHWALVVFYLLSGYPLEGGRLLRAALARRAQLPRATRIATWPRVGIALLGMVAGIMLLVQGKLIAGLWVLALAALLLSAGVRPLIGLD